MTHPPLLVPVPRAALAAAAAALEDVAAGPGADRAARILRAALNGKRVGVGEVLAGITQGFLVSAASVTGRRRDRATVAARMAAAFLLRELTGMTLVRRAELLGQRSHATLIDIEAQALNRWLSDPDFAARLDRAAAHAVARALDSEGDPPSWD